MIPTAYTTDTTPEAHAVQLECLRRISGAEHFAMMCSTDRECANDGV